jgi:hypothetical protein
MRPFIRRVFTWDRSLRPATVINRRWAREVWRMWLRGHTSFDLGLMWEQRVCPFCAFVWRVKHGPESDRESSQKAADALGACRCCLAKSRRTITVSS